MQNKRMQVPSILSPKVPGKAFHVDMLIPLPTDTPYGNLNPKIFDLIFRIEDANFHIENSFHTWRKAINKEISVEYPVIQHKFANEHAVYQMRKIGDEFISLIWCLSMLEKTGNWPSNIRVDTFGSYLNTQNPEDISALEVFHPHRTLLERLNNISNAFKHSFANTDTTVIGRDEPCVSYIHFERNNARSPAIFQNISLSALISDFNLMSKDAFQWLRNFSERQKMNPEDKEIAN